MNVFNTISKWFWAGCILVTIFNGAIFCFRARKRIEKDPNLEEGYKKIIKGFVTWGNLPWVVMAIGCTYGGVPSVWHYFNPEEGNPYVLSFFASVILIWILGSYWILFRGGARTIVDHPGILNYDIKSTTVVKLIWVAGIFGGIIAFFMMFTQEIPIPKI